ncbi:MAG: hypothetical protein ACREDM_00115 [Methylocella sp.]
MQTYQFIAFRDERYAAHGEIQAETPEDARAKIMDRYYDEGPGLEFNDYVDGETPDHFMLTDESGEEYHLEDETPPDVFKALKALIQKADDLIAAIYGVTDQFGHEVSALTDAASAAEKAMMAAGGAA